MTNIIRVLVVDDHSKVHRGIAALIDVFDDLELVGHASNGHEALELCRDQNPDVILMDVIMPGMDGIEATKRILEQQPGLTILALSSFSDNESVRDMIRAGAVGYVLKNSSIDDLAQTIRAAHTGTSVFSAEVTKSLIEFTQPVRQHVDYGLTDREVEILRLIVQGLSNSEIASKLVVSISTVKFHVSNVLAKLNVASRVEAVAISIEQHLID